MTATVAGCLTTAGELVNDGHVYDNSEAGRCDPSDPPASRGLDCATFVALYLILNGVDVDACTNSFALEALCRSTPRPQWMTALWGDGVGTQIPQEVALAIAGSWWFESTGVGHIETGTGADGGLFGSVGAHSHATGIGYTHWFPGFFDNYYLDPFLLDDFERIYSPQTLWKVAPMFNPPLQVVAVLADPDGGVWLGFDSGVVLYYSSHQVEPVVGGMVTEADQQAFAGRHLARLTPRKYGPFNHKHGYTIVATSGETYVPAGQH